MNIVTLAGGVGGAKLAHGLTLTLTPTPALPRDEEGNRRGGSLTVIVNTGDDFEWHGLYICPDLDTVTYTLAGLANPVAGWGIADDTFEALGALQRLGTDPWFKIGDRDLATHLRRTELLRAGKTLTEATQIIARALGIEATLLPMTDDRFRTMVETDQGELEFQEYFVRQQWQPIIKRIHFDGAETAQASTQVCAAIEQAAAIIIALSNPFVSIDPILTLTHALLSLTPQKARGLRGRGDGGEGRPVAAISPIVGGQAIKGPAAKIFHELGVEPSALAVAQHYHGIVTHFVLDQLDAGQESAIQSLGMRTLVTDTIMQTVEDRVSLAQEVLEFITSN